MEHWVQRALSRNATACVQYSAEHTSKSAQKPKRNTIPTIRRVLYVYICLFVAAIRFICWCCCWLPRPFAECVYSSSLARCCLRLFVLSFRGREFCVYFIGIISMAQNHSAGRSVSTFVKYSDANRNFRFVLRRAHSGFLFAERLHHTDSTRCPSANAIPLTVS